MSPSPTATRVPGPPAQASRCPPVAVTGPSARPVELGPTAGMPWSPAKGEPMIIEGVALDGECAPLASETLSAWQTDAAGHYGPTSPGTSLGCCYYAAEFMTTAKGRFAMASVRPATAPAPDGEVPAHVHIGRGAMAATRYDIVIVFEDYGTESPPPLMPGQFLVVLSKATDASGGITWHGFAQVEFLDN